MDKRFNIMIIIFCYVIKTAYLQCPIAQVCVHDQVCWGSSVLLPGLHIFGCCSGCGDPSDAPNDPDTGTTGCRPPATCLPDGTFAPVQCRGDQFTGRCFCTNEHGTTIFGQMWRNEAEGMTCACSRRRAELEAKENRTVTLHCTTSGDYEPLQCDDGLCWCAEPRTGQPTVIPVPEEDMRRLPCYSTSEIGMQYLRQCESLAIASTRITQEQSRHGTNFFGNPIPSCDYDGTYGPVQIRNDNAYCKGPDGASLGNWHVAVSDMAGMTCNCARDFFIHFPARGMTMTQTCLANGNYRPEQNIGDVFFCVDSNGYPVTDFLDAWPEEGCKSFT
ncbi:unnamed protein product [Arctia plantaginis]|uniref:Thyroglobulin type-1 domain-containing protein n=1 Tax=Arctia plantaginis TaxID=874455 RepID=A0A8S1BJX0_ARCPL|nr:unnamed protein product [Arctia plantaginis]